MPFTTSDRTKQLIDFVRDRLLALPYFQQTKDDGSPAWTTRQLYRKNSPQVKDPSSIMPCLIFSWDSDIREVTTDIDHGIMTVQVYTNEYTNTEQAGNSIADALHLLVTVTGDNPPLIIYQSHDLGGPSEPYHNTETNSWSTACNFKMRVG